MIGAVNPKGIIFGLLFLKNKREGRLLNAAALSSVKKRF